MVLENRAHNLLLEPGETDIKIVRMSTEKMELVCVYAMNEWTNCSTKHSETYETEKEKSGNLILVEHEMKHLDFWATI